MTLTMILEGDFVMKVEIQKEAYEVIQKLNSQGFRAYLVGGCLRDYLMGFFPSDFDVATDAKPQQVMSLFEKVIPTGISHGTVTVIISGVKIEVTTFRIDKQYKAHRWPEVEFTDSLFEDLKRRDFTINALAYHPEEGLIDFFGGIDDLKNKIIRCVGDAKDRFFEDALRILRCIRFASQLSFMIDEKTFEALKSMSFLLNNISKERINAELTKIINSKNCKYGLKLLHDSGVGQIIINRFDDIYKSLSKIDFDEIVNLKVPSFFSVLADSKAIEETMRSLKYDKKSIKFAKRIGFYLQDENINVMKIKKIFFENPKDAEHIILCLAKLKNDFEIISLYNDLKEKNELLEKKDIRIDGNDLIAAGLNGTAIKDVLQKTYDYVLLHPEKNNKEELLGYVNQLIKLGNK